MALTAKKVYAILKRQISDMEAKLNSPVRYRGTVATADLLPLNPDIGDMYNIESKSIYGEAGMNVAWNGVVWDTMGAPIDMSLYLTKEEAETVIQRLVTEYFEKNPVKPGATTEQAQQIEQNKTDIASLKTETNSLKESISTKITKFYASSQGENHLADSDNGKIVDMMVYGKSSQDGTPTPENPVEIKSVVNPTVKVCGKNFYPDGDLIGLTKAYVTDFIPVNLYLGILHMSFDATTDANDGMYGIGVTYCDKNKKNIGSNGKAEIVGQALSTKAFSLNGGNAGINDEPLDLKTVSYIKIRFDIYNNTATKITYKNIMVSTTDSTYEPYKPVQTVTLPYTLNAIPVSSGGNVTIDGQQYVSDYFDVESGKLVRMVEKAIALPTYVISQSTGNKNVFAIDFSNYAKAIKTVTNGMGITCMSNKFESSNTVDTWYEPKNTIKQALFANKTQIVFITDVITIDDFKAILSTSETYVIYQCEPIEESIPNELAEKLKALQSRYPQTNILITSDELDGYTVFNYPISMAQGWDYVKKQLNDNRDYIYDMDIRTQDTDLQAAEAYVNSEYAVALTELEV